MDSKELSKCDSCKEPVSFICRRCEFQLCDKCIPQHLRVKSNKGHDVVHVDIATTDEEEVCFCDSHPQNECLAFCKTCAIPICILCVSIKHKFHEISELSEKMDELLNEIAQESNRLQSFKDDLETVLTYTSKMLSSSSSFYQQRKDEVTARGEEWHRLIARTVRRLHQELDVLKTEHELLLQKQKEEFEDEIKTVEEMNQRRTKLQKSKNVVELEKFSFAIKEYSTVKEFRQNTFPTFHECKIDENYLKSYFGYIEKGCTQDRKLPLIEKVVTSNTDYTAKMLEVPEVFSVIDTDFPTDEDGNRLYGMAVTDDKKVWVGGESNELKLFDLMGNLHRIVTIPWLGMYLCRYNKQVVFNDETDNTVNRIIDEDFVAVFDDETNIEINRITDGNSVVTMFSTGDWSPRGITGTASGDLLICLYKDDHDKVVRYSSTGTVLQEIQYDSQGQPLYEEATYVAENVNMDVVVTDWKKNVVIAVDQLGMFRYSYSGSTSDFDACAVATDSFGHVIVTDFNGDKIHMLDRDGQFLRYIIPGAGIKQPRAVCMIGDGEMIVGECLTGFAKGIKFLQEK